MMNYSVPERRCKNLSYHWIMHNKRNSVPRMICSVQNIILELQKILHQSHLKMLLVMCTPFRFSRQEKSFHQLCQHPALNITLIPKQPLPIFAVINPFRYHARLVFPFAKIFISVSTANCASIIAIASTVQSSTLHPSRVTICSTSAIA